MSYFVISLSFKVLLWRKDIMLLVPWLGREIGRGRLPMRPLRFPKEDFSCVSGIMVVVDLYVFSRTKIHTKIEIRVQIATKRLMNHFPFHMTRQRSKRSISSSWYSCIGNGGYAYTIFSSVFGSDIAGYIQISHRGTECAEFFNFD